MATSSPFYKLHVTSHWSPTNGSSTPFSRLGGYQTGSFDSLWASSCQSAPGMVDSSQDGSSRGARTFDAQEPVELRDYAYPAAAGLCHIAVRSSYTDPLVPDGYTSQRGGGARIVCRDNISNRFAIRLRGFRAFRGTIVLVQEQNLSFLWWGTHSAGWDEWRTGQAVNLTGCPEDRFVKSA